MGDSMMLPLVLATAFAAPVKMTPMEAGATVRLLFRQRRAAQRWLAQDRASYLATIGRYDFGTKRTLAVGSAPDEDVRLEGRGLRPHHLEVTVAGEEFEVQAVDSKATFLFHNAPMRTAKMTSGSLRVGRFTLRLSNQNYPAILVQDPKSPRFEDYKGLQFFPIDFAYRYILPLTPNPKPETVVILSTRGDRRKALRVGWFDFLVHGERCRLEVDRLLEPGLGESDLSVFFRDQTTGHESYPVGRYVDPEKLSNGEYLLDFNLAYNPACAYSPYYNCPIPPRANRLRVAIRAGEMDAHYRH